MILLGNLATDSRAAVEGLRPLLATSGVDLVCRQAEPEFDLAALLAEVYAIARQVAPDWAVLNAPDEWLQSREDEPLPDLFGRAAAEGANVVNFEEFVFLPPPRAVVAAEDARDVLVDYYFFAPRRGRLMRAWRPGDGVADADGAGHHFTGSSVRVATEEGILRHYPVLSSDHARAKYLGRTYAPANLARGWHKNRLGLRPDDLDVTDASPHMRRLPSPASRDFDRSRPARAHYWDPAWREGQAPNWAAR